MKHTLTLITAMLLTPLATMAQQTATPAAARLVGDGAHDDTTAIQALLDSRRSLVYLPAPAKHYLISRPLRIHSNQTLQLDRFAVIRLKDGSDCLMITNDDHERGNENIALVGGVWDMHNEGQSLCEYQKTRIWKGTYDPVRYLGVLMRFNRVKRLTLRSLTLKDPVTFSTQLGNLDEFTIEDITFNHNLKRSNMDGIHVHGPARHGRITNIKGATNDDLVALNADDGGIYEMSRGPIEDVAVDGLWATNGWTAVRLLSAGSPIRRIRLANIFGTYRINVVSFTNHNVHPGAPSTFEDITIDGVFASKSGDSKYAPIWIASPARIGTLTIRDYHRTETVNPVPDILIDQKCQIENLSISDFSSINRASGEYSAIENNGDITVLNISNMYIKAEGGEARGSILGGHGQIKTNNLVNVKGVNLAI